MPSLVGLDQSAATASVRELGATLVIERSVFDEQVAAGIILQSSPGAGRRVKAGSVIRVVISKGPERYLVPDLVGMTVDQADAALKNVNLLLGERSEAFSDTIPAGRIISTTPVATSPTRGGSIVSIVVSKGQQLTVLADFTGVDADQAMSELGDAGFAPTTTLAYSETAAEGTVISQSPVAGSYPPGTAVTLTISLGSEFVTVPSVKGLALIDAGRLLENMGLRFLPASPSKATVIGQSVAAGTKVKRGTLITLTIKK